MGLTLPSHGHSKCTSSHHWHCGRKANGCFFHLGVYPGSSWADSTKEGLSGWCPCVPCAHQGLRAPVPRSLENILQSVAGRTNALGPHPSQSTPEAVSLWVVPTPRGLRQSEVAESACAGGTRSTLPVLGQLHRSRAEATWVLTLLSEVTSGVWAGAGRWGESTRRTARPLELGFGSGEGELFSLPLSAALLFSAA